jgi:ABC-2 type transport system ATP-binding protein
MDSHASPPQSDAAIVVRNFTREFGSKVAVNDISFEVSRGSFFGFLGPNGAGKSTTVRMLTGLLPPTSGNAWIDGRSILSEPVNVKRHMGVIPDDLALFDRLSLSEHLTLAGQMHELPGADIESRTEDLLRLLDLWDDRGTHAVDASHGMRKKTALAMALIHRPRVLFLDEPFEGIDPIASRHIRSLLSQLAKSGATIFLTSHILEIIERLADRVAIIVAGSLAVEESLESLRRSGGSLEDVFVEAVGEPAERPDLSWLA